jgi:hypothetical protein
VELFRKGYVVLPRIRHYAKQGKRRSRVPEPPGYTLHRETCAYVKRSTRHVPAPIEPYPGTVTCPYCRPSLIPEVDAS